jgi:thioredoxin 1
MAVLIGTDGDFEKTLETSEKVIVKYYADWCGSCKLIAPKFKRLSNDEQHVGTTFLEINAEENEIARKMANVDNLPYFATFKNGTLLNGSATSKEEVIVSLLKELV